MRCEVASLLPRFFLFFAFALAAIPDQAQACTCRSPGTPQEELSQPYTGSVFLGRVLQISPAGAPHGRTVIFARSKVWKGPLDPLLATTTPDYSAACGIDFVPGREYLVYEHTGGSVILCSRTQPAAMAADDLAALGPGLTPQAASVADLTRHAQLAGSWYNPSRSGEGFVVETLDSERGAVYWFGYDQENPERQAWMSGIGAFEGSSLNVELLRPVGGGFGDFYRADQVSRPVWGSLRLVLRPDGTGEATFLRHPSTSGVVHPPVSFPIQRLTRPPATPAGAP
jgi:hypothetical protein